MEEDSFPAVDDLSDPESWFSGSGTQPVNVLNGKVYLYFQHGLRAPIRTFGDVPASLTRLPRRAQHALMVRLHAYNAVTVAAGLVVGAALALAPSDVGLAAAGRYLFHWLAEPFTRLLYAGISCV